MLLCERSHRAIEHEIFRPLIHQLGQTHLLMPLLAQIFHGVDFALHYVKLVIHVWQSARGLDDNQAIHPVRNMLGSQIRSAVIYKYSWNYGLERKSLTFFLFCFRQIHSAAWSKSSMQVNRMGNETPFIL